MADATVGHIADADLTVLAGYAQRLAEIVAEDTSSLTEFLEASNGYHRHFVGLGRSPQLTDTYKRLGISALWREAIAEHDWRRKFDITHHAELTAACRDGDVARAEQEEARARAQARAAASAAAQADVAVAESTADRTRLDLDRAARLATGGLIAQQELDGARTAQRSAVATLDASRRRLAQAERDLRPVKIQQRTSGGTWRTLAGLADFAVVQSYLSTARKWGIDSIDALTRLFTTGAWLPPAAAPC